MVEDAYKKIRRGSRIVAAETAHTLGETKRLDSRRRRSHLSDSDARNIRFYSRSGHFGLQHTHHLNRLRNAKKFDAVLRNGIHLFLSDGHIQFIFLFGFRPRRYR